MSSAEAELALLAIQGLRGGVAYLRHRDVSIERFAEQLRLAESENREFDIEDLQVLVDARSEAREALDAEIARRRREQ